MKKHLLWIVPLLLALYAVLYVATTSTETINIVVKKQVTRIYDRDFQGWLFWPAARIEGLLRRPDDFVFRQRVLGI
jgi:hypothetical protein